MTTTFEIIWSEHQNVVHDISRRFGAQFHSMGASHEDFRQEAVCWMLDNEDDLAELYEEMEPEEFSRYLARCIENEFKDYGVDIRDQAGGQPRAGAYWYGTAELKTLLPSMLDPQKWHEPPQYDSETRAPANPAHGNNWVATLADVSQAFARLEQADQMLLRDLHQYGIRNKDLAEMNEVTEATMSYRHTQALKRLLKNLGGERPKQMRPDVKYDPWRGRHSVSTAQARAIQSSYYEE